jgi:hypothetical protein
LKKKILMLITAITLTVGIGVSVKKANEEAGNPPVGSFTDTTTQVASGDYTTMGNPPVGS